MKIYYLFIFVFFYSCADRNKIEFNDSISVVENSISEIHDILSEYKIKNFYFNYNDELILNSEKVGSYEDGSIKFTILGKIEIKRLGLKPKRKAIADNLLILLKNKIRGAYFNVVTKKYNFTYMRIYDERDEDRSIIILRDLDDRVLKFYNVIEEKNNLVLITSKTKEEIEWILKQK